MPGKASGKAEAQRERQQRYRRRLAALERRAGADAVDSAVSPLLERVRLQGENAREAVRQRRGELRLLLSLRALGDAASAARSISVRPWRNLPRCAQRTCCSAYSTARSPCSSTATARPLGARCFTASLAHQGKAGNEVKTG